MLNAMIHIEGYDIHILQLNPNILFVYGMNDEQHVARLGKSVGPHVRTYKLLKTFLVGQFVSYSYVVQGDLRQSWPMIFHVIVEAIRLGWPIEWIACSMCSIPRRFTSPVIRAIRKFGNLLNRFDAKTFIDMICIERLMEHNPVAYVCIEHVVGVSWGQRFHLEIAIGTLKGSVFAPCIPSDPLSLASRSAMGGDSWYGNAGGKSSGGKGKSWKSSSPSGKSFGHQQHQGQQGYQHDQQHQPQQHRSYFQAP